MKKISELPDRLLKALRRPSSKGTKPQPPDNLEQHGLGGVRVSRASIPITVTPAKGTRDRSPRPLTMERILRLSNRVAKSLGRLSSKGGTSPPPSNQPQHAIRDESQPRTATSNAVTVSVTTQPAPNTAPRRRQRRITNPPPLLTQPDDVLYLIREHLTISGANCLSLICKRFYAVLNPDLCGADLGESRESFLRLLELDAPDRLVYCHFCSRVHHLPLSNELSCAFGTASGVGGGGRSWSYRIDWPLVRAVTNRHFLARPGFGGSGRPAEESPFRLVPGRHWTCHWPSWQTFQHARIIGGELYLRSIHRLYPRPDPGPRPPDVNSAPADERDICEHIVSGSVEYYKPAYRSRALKTRMYKSKSGRVRRGESWITDKKSPVPVQKRIGSCEICYTDYSRGILKDEEKGGWVVFVATFQRVGSGRRPDELPWVCGNNLDCVTEMPTRRGLGDKYISVREMWILDEFKDDL